MSDFLAGVLGFVTFLLVYFWVFSFFVFHEHFWRFAWFRELTDDGRRNSAFAAMLIGAAILWLAWEYLLPDWWKSSTPMMSYD